MFDSFVGMRKLFHKHCTVLNQLLWDFWEQKFDVRQPLIAILGWSKKSQLKELCFDQ